MAANAPLNPNQRCSRIARVITLVSAFALAFLSSCGMESGTEYTLYRTGIDIPTQTHDETLRIHVATFDAALLDADQNAKYNLANCEFTREFFANNQPHFRDYRSNTVAPGTMKVKYWCERGRFKK